MISASWWKAPLISRNALPAGWKPGGKASAIRQWHSVSGNPALYSLIKTILYEYEVSSSYIARLLLYGPDLRPAKDSAANGSRRKTCPGEQDPEYRFIGDDKGRSDHQGPAYSLQCHGRH